MADNINAYCDICGKGYHMCISCRDMARTRPWQKHTCCAEHYKVFQIVRGVNTGVYTKSEANERLDNVNLSDLNSFKPSVKRLVKSIIRENKASKVAEPTKVQEVTEIAEVPEVSDAPEVISVVDNFGVVGEQEGANDTEDASEQVEAE